MGTVKVYNNFFEEDFINFLNNYFLSLPHYYGHSSAKGNDFFYVTNLNIQDPLISFLINKIVNKIKKNLDILRIYINIQHKEMDGGFHQDDGDETYLIMVSKTLDEKSGEFQIINENNELNTFNFVQNKMLVFPAKLRHRGMAPKERNTPRITLLLKTKNINE